MSELNIVWLTNKTSLTYLQNTIQLTWRVSNATFFGNEYDGSNAENVVLCELIQLSPSYNENTLSHFTILKE